MLSSFFMSPWFGREGAKIKFPASMVFFQRQNSEPWTNYNLKKKTADTHTQMHSLHYYTDFYVNLSQTKGNYVSARTTTVNKIELDWCQNPLLCWGHTGLWCDTSLHINFWCQSIHIGARLPQWKWYQSISRLPTPTKLTYHNPTNLT